MPSAYRCFCLPKYEREGVPMKKIIELRNITKSFGGEPVLKGIDLDIYDSYAFKIA